MYTYTDTLIHTYVHNFFLTTRQQVVYIITLYPYTLWHLFPKRRLSRNHSTAITFISKGNIDSTSVSVLLFDIQIFPSSGLGIAGFCVSLASLIWNLLSVSLSCLTLTLGDNTVLFL